MTVLLNDPQKFQQFFERAQGALRYLQHIDINIALTLLCRLLRSFRLM